MFNINAGVCMLEICVGMFEINVADFAVRNIYMTWPDATFVDIVCFSHVNVRGCMVAVLQPSMTNSEVCRVVGNTKESIPCAAMV